METTLTSSITITVRNDDGTTTSAYYPNVISHTIERVDPDTIFSLATRYDLCPEIHHKIEPLPNERGEYMKLLKLDEIPTVLEEFSPAFTKEELRVMATDYLKSLNVMTTERKG